MSPRLARKTLPVAMLLAVFVAVLYVPAFAYTRELAAGQVLRGETSVLPVYNSDSAGYVALADNLVAHARFGTGSIPDTFRTPGYPALLALWKLVFGSYDFFPLLQIALVFGTALLIFLIGRGLFSFGVGAAAAALFTLDPNTLYHSLVILSEIPYVFLIALAAYLVFVPRRRFLPSEWLAGFVLGLSVYVKPVSLYLPAVFVAYLLLREIWNRREGRARRFVSAALLLVLAYAAVLLPWLARDWRVSGAWGISSVSSFNLFVYTAPEFLSYREGITPDQARAQLARQTPVPPAQYANLRYSSKLQSAALGVVFAHPLSFAKFYAVKTVPFFFSSSLNNIFVTLDDVLGEERFPTSNANLTNLLLKGDVGAVWRQIASRPAVAAEQVILGLVCLFALLSFLDRKRFPEVAALALLVAYFAAVTGVVAYARFRIPASPFLFILASAGFSASIGFVWKRAREKPGGRSPSSSPHTTNPPPLTSFSAISLPSDSRKGSRRKSSS